MGTRAHIRMVCSQGEIKLYRHCDGYPSDLGVSLKRFLENQKVWDIEFIADSLIKEGLPYHDRDGLRHRISPAVCMCGLENYVYIVDCDNKKLTCYKHELDESYKKCCIPKRICQIE